MFVMLVCHKKCNLNFCHVLTPNFQFSGSTPSELTKCLVAPVIKNERLVKGLTILLKHTLQGMMGYVSLSAIVQKVRPFVFFCFSRSTFFLFGPFFVASTRQLLHICCYRIKCFVFSCLSVRGRSIFFSVISVKKCSSIDDERFCGFFETP